MTAVIIFAKNTHDREEIPTSPAYSIDLSTLLSLSLVFLALSATQTKSCITAPLIEKQSKVTVSAAAKKVLNTGGKRIAMAKGLVSVKPL